MELIDNLVVKEALVKREKDSNKGTFGSLLTICGSYSMAGAGILAGKGALRSGIGLLKMALPESIYPIIAWAIFESVYYPLKGNESGTLSKKETPFLLKKADECRAVLIGCGMQNNSDTRFITRSFIERCSKPLILDADALNSIADDVSILKNANSPVIITPHPGEMARLINNTVSYVQENREEVAKAFAKENRVYVVLKGYKTIVATPDGRAKVNNTGNPGMATGGSGDVLAGIISSLVAQNPAKSFECACAGVYVHGLAGDIAKDKLGEISMLPTDLIDCLPEAFKKCN
ncbi:MAG: NAD(P)H-hydrate dehydratase [Ruminococcus sp.]|nr:NAD(P)H-hydrate dehydratase [Ruminococcus sp.]